MGKDRKLKAYRKTKDEGNSIDYRKISLSVKEWLICVSIGILCTVGIAVLFYRSFAAIFIAPVMVILSVGYKKGAKRREMQMRLKRQFLEFLRLLADALEAGFSMELGLNEAEKELAVLYEETEMIRVEAAGINRCIRANIPFSEAITDFAERSRDEDIRSFAKIMSFAGKSGGNYIKIIRNTIRIIYERIDTANDIEVFLAEKVLEAKVMCIMPIAILLLLTVQSSEYLNPLYGNQMGVIIMTTMLILYATAIYLALVISKVKV